MHGELGFFDITPSENIYTKYDVIWLYLVAEAVT